MKAACGILLASVLALSFPVLASAQASSDAPCTDLNTNMSLGSTDGSLGEVTELQTFLNDESYLKASPTGYFGMQTQAAVEAFQTANKIDAIGIAGPATRAKIKSITCGDDSDGFGSGSVLSYLTVSCSPSFYEAAPGAPVTWTAYISGATEPYSYSWSGGEGLSGRGSATEQNPVAITKSYQSQGEDEANLYATSADGQTFTADCGSVSIASDPDAGLSEGQSDAPTWYGSLLSDSSWFGSTIFGSSYDGSEDSLPPQDQLQEDAGNGTGCDVVTGCGSGAAAPLQPFISSLSETDAHVGDTVTITGSGFTAQNAIVIDGNSQIPGIIASPDGTTLTFAVPSSLDPACSFIAGACTNSAETFDPGYSYDLYVVSLDSDGVARISTSTYFALVQ